MARLVHGLRCVVNRSYTVARLTGVRSTVFQHRSMHNAPSAAFAAPSLLKSVQV